ncbi:MAG: hypothetical protein MET45_26030 [Nostoc sp. LLA-1]|nr:hypothetical protein [Cyanocohniella sp. LLY]
MVSKKSGLQGRESQATTLTLLALWDLGGLKAEVKKSDLTKRIIRTHEKAKDYQGIFEGLQQAGAIAIAIHKRVTNISLTDKGVQMLGEGLQSHDFQFEGYQVGAKVANALVQWIRQKKGAAIASVTPEQKAQENAIASYDEFKSVVLEVYDKLNQNHSLDDLVPIYRLRREIGDRVSRTDFNTWLLEMQKNDIIQLIGGEMTDITPDKAEDSITTKLSGLRYYAKRLSSAN